MNYYRRYPGDYLRKTGKLSVTEHGAYTLMLDNYYSEEEPLPADHEEIYRLVRAMTPSDRKAVDKVLSRYFELRDDGYHNKRADEELAIARPAIEASRANGKKGGERPTSRKITRGTTHQITRQKTQRILTRKNPAGIRRGYNRHPPATTPCR